MNHDEIISRHPPMHAGIHTSLYYSLHKPTHREYLDIGVSYVHIDACVGIPVF